MVVAGRLSGTVSHFRAVKMFRQLLWTTQATEITPSKKQGATTLWAAKIPEEAAESAKFTVQSIICHRTRETEARATQGQDEGRMGREA